LNRFVEFYTISGGKQARLWDRSRGEEEKHWRLTLNIKGCWTVSPAASLSATTEPRPS